MRDPVGRLVVADSGNNRVQVLNAPVGGRRRRSTCYPAGRVALSRPADVALGPGAKLYVTDPGNGRVVRLSYDDADSDGAIDARDTCPGLANADQRDTDRDGRGDACDEDDDNDGRGDAADLCPRSARGPDANRDGCADPASRITVPGRVGRRSAAARRHGSPVRVGRPAGRGSVEVALARGRRLAAAAGGRAGASVRWGRARRPCGCGRAGAT